MGVIRKQAAWQSIINYLGTAIGAVAILWVYPLNGDAYGLAQFLVSTSQFLIPFLSLGVVTLVVRYFPEYETDEWRKSYLMNMLLLSTIGVVIMMLVVWLFGAIGIEFLRKLGFRDEYLYQYGPQLLLMAVIITYNQIFTLHASNYKKIVVPAVFQNLLPKLTLPPLILLLYFGKINSDLFINAWISTFLLTFLGLLWYLYRIKALDIWWRFGLLTKKLLKRMAAYASFAGAGLVGNNLISRIDVVLIALLIDFHSSGVYFIAVFLARVVQIPTSAVSQISAPIVADSWVHNALDDIEYVYKKAGLNLFVVGTFIFFLVLIEAVPLFSFSTNSGFLLRAVPVFVFLGITQLISMLTSINYHVLIYSRYYRVELLFIIIAGGMNLPLTYFLIKSMGIIGAAISTMIATATLNLMRLIFIWVRFRIHPFGPRSVYTIILVAFSLLFYFFMPRMESQLANLFVLGISYTAGYVAIAEALSLTTDFKPFVSRVLSKFGIRLSPPTDDQ